MLRSGLGRGDSERGLGEVIARKAFDFTLRAVEEGREDVKLLVAHDPSKPVATTASGTMRLQDTDEALTFEAELIDTQAAREAVEMIRSGVARGLSFGFQLPPRRRVTEAVEMVREPTKIDGVDFPAEDGVPGADIRIVRAAILREISIAVTFPVYRENEAEVRAEDFVDGDPAPKQRRRPLWLL